MTAKQIIDLAKSQIGVHESPPNSNNVIYNQWYYGKSVSGPEFPWCAVFISWLFRGDQSLCPRTASCVNMLAWFEQKRQIVKKPQAGDIVFFKYSTNARRTNHVGLVVSVSEDGRTINTIEGNTSVTNQDNGGKVMQRNRYSNIVAYARPRYEGTQIETHKTNEEIAKEVIDGKWGVGAERKRRLIQAGYDYKEIQKIVNDMLRR